MTSKEIAKRNRVEAALMRLRAALPKRRDVQLAMRRTPPSARDEIISGFTRALRENPELLIGEDQEAVYQSIMDSLCDALDLGLVPGREGYFIKYKDKVHFQAGWRGILRLVRQSGVRKIDVREVRAADHFEIEFGDDERILHKMSKSQERDQTPITHVYAIALLGDGERKREVWTAAQIDAHKERFSESWNRAERSGKRDSPWHTSWPSMAAKTVLLAICKTLPQSTEIRRIADLERKTDKPAEDVVDLEPGDFLGDARMAEAAADGPDGGAEDSEPARLTEGAVDRLERLDRALEGCESILQCQEAQKLFSSAAESTHETAAIMAAVDAKCEAIRGGRGERSGKH